MSDQLGSKEAVVSHSSDGETHPRAAANPHDEIDCLGVRVAHLDWPGFRQWFAARAHGGRQNPSILYFVNAHSLNWRWHHPEFRAVLNRADLVLNDGAGLHLASLVAGRAFVYNFNGTDLFPRLFAELSAEARPLRVYLYGAAPGRAEVVAGIIGSRYPAIEVAGTRDGYSDDDETVVAAINSIGPDLLLVAKGTPLQEEWLDTNASALRVGVAAGVGGLFDFMSGATPRAPRWMRALRLEWVFRLLHEPRRMFGRYVLGVPAFLSHVLVTRLWPERSSRA